MHTDDELQLFPVRSESRDWWIIYSNQIHEHTVNLYFKGNAMHTQIAFWNLVVASL